MIRVVAEDPASPRELSYVAPLRQVDWFALNLRWMLGYFIVAFAGVAIGVGIFAHASLRDGLEAGLLAGMVSAVALGALGVPIAKWWARRQNDPPPLQHAWLEGARVVRIVPSRFESDLAEEHAVVVGVTGTQASARWLRAEGDVVLHVDVGPATSFSGAGPAEPREWGRECGERYERGRRFGDRLLALLDEHRHLNRYLSLVEQLENAPVRDASVPLVVELEESSGEASPYRAGQPEPGHPGFETWLEREGRALGSDLVLGAEHLVARCTDGRRYAFPIGATRARRNGDQLILAPLAAPLEEEREATVADPVLASAIVVWLHGRQGG